MLAVQVAVEVQIRLQVAQLPVVDRQAWAADLEPRLAQLCGPGRCVGQGQAGLQVELAGAAAGQADRQWQRAPGQVARQLGERVGRLDPQVQRVGAQGWRQRAQPLCGQSVEVQVGCQAFGEPLACDSACGDGEIALHLARARDGPGLGQAGAGVDLAAGAAQSLQAQGAGGQLQLPGRRESRGARCAGQSIARDERPLAEPVLQGRGLAEIGRAQVAAP
ncbi:hypothetical protein D3C85_660380 [compost metagenome]